ncbi:cell division protein ZipA-like [Bombus pascuorum]|uniref:cell division protein ZipA-like n=1 Tax=Bombus pascuorum TaxID=65598 RepID=UPI00298DBCA9|nr:cell division protein ZipA-like [Bombus pascuorum]
MRSESCQRILILAVVVPIYATGDVFGDLLGQEFQYATIDHVRDRRQAGHLRTVNQAPAQIQQLLHAQQFRPPVVPVPAQPIPKLGPAQPSQPQQLSQAQVSQYRPQVQFASGVQQPDYRSIPLGGRQKPILPQQPQYRPLPQQNFNAAPQYSSKLPPHIQQLLQFQNNLSNSIPRRA